MLSRSVFVRCAILIIACTTAVAATISLMSYRFGIVHVIDNAQHEAAHITQFVAQEAGGAVRFGKADVLAELFDKAISNSEGAAYGALAMKADGSVIVTTDGLNPTQLSELSTRALNSSTIERSPDGLHMAVPVYFGKDSALIGAIAIAWTAEENLARIQRDNFISLATAAGTLLVSISISLFVLSRSIVRPLVNLRDAVHHLSDGDYSESEGFAPRRDEIGQIGKAVETLRQVLNAAEGLRVETTFKGAGYESSSTAAMLVDQGFTVQYLNASARLIIDDYATQLGVDQASGAIGKVVRDLHPALAELQDKTQENDGVPVTMDVEMGSTRFSVSISEIRNSDNELTGFVMEWHDVTEQRILSAIRRCIDDAQCEVRLSSQGMLDSANGVFCDSVGAQISELKGRQLDSLFQPETDAGAATAPWAAIEAGESVSGRFTVTARPGQPRLIEGDFKPILDDQGVVVNAMFLGKDITEQDARIRTAETLRMKLETEQRVAMEGIREALGALAAGDLSVQMRKPFAEAYEQLRADFNSASRQLCKALGEVNENSSSIGAGVTALTAAADQLASRTERQAATLEETAAALDELTVSVKTAAAGADTADEVVSQTKVNAEKGEQVVGEAIKAMNEIEASSGQISKIISVIDDIAFQTNLLALNAGVEAARAGEAGRGFAVVASEVRALAQRSSEAASEIDHLISSSSQQVKRGVDLVGQTGAALNKILGSVSNVATIVSEIAESASQQSSGLSEINTSMMDLDQVTQQNAAMFEETNAMAQTLSDSVKILADAVAQFRTELPEGDEAWDHVTTALEDERLLG